MGKYNLSFTAATLRLYNFMRLAKAVEGISGEIKSDSLDPNEILGKGNARSNKRELNEHLKRYNALTAPQRRLLADSDADGAKQIAFLGLCKANRFMRDFVVEVVREKTLVFDYSLEDVDLTSFINRKSELHPEINSFATSTMKKAKQHVFKILEEAGIIDNVKNRAILPQWVSPKLAKAIVEDNPEYLKVFLVSEKDIKLSLTQ